jgi:hypothetical protein
MPTGKICTLYWFNNDDPNDALIGSQEVNCQGPSPFDDFTQGSWVIASIGPYFTAPGGPPLPGPPNVLKGPIGGISQGIPWWWLAGQSYNWPSTPSIYKPNAGTGKPYYY